MKRPKQLNFLTNKNLDITISDCFDPARPINLILGDRLKFLQQIKESGQAAELVVTSPPYNTGKAYEVKTSLEEYVEEQK